MVKRLTDLYKTGKEIVFTVEGEPDLVVWLQKLQPFEQEIAITRAQGERAKVWALKKLPDDDPERAVHIMQVEDEFDHEQMVNLCASEELSKALQSAEAYIAMDDPENNEWAKDDYLEGLREAWAGAQLALHNEDDPTAQTEAKRVFEELKRFNKQVEDEFEIRRKAIVESYERQPEDTLKAKCVDKIIEVRADIRWMAEYEKSCVWLATREPMDHSKPYFERRADVDNLSPIVLTRLTEEYKNLTTAPEEGKD